ncbi:mid region of cactin-domain-containing protein [Phlyctochytrium arcticum]|nr:mid region of cactin-domain-containing protein [Phlyctochytrium arcticum]
MPRRDRSPERSGRSRNRSVSRDRDRSHSDGRKGRSARSPEQRIQRKSSSRGRDEGRRYKDRSESIDAGRSLPRGRDLSRENSSGRRRGRDSISPSPRRRSSRGSPERSQKRSRSRSQRHHGSSESESDHAPKRSRKDKSSSKKKRETSEERRARKAERKAEKRQLKDDLKAQKESQIAAQMSASLGYSNTENPFGDSNLSSKFVWLKKREREAKDGLRATDRVKRDVNRREEIDTELDKLKMRRTEREYEQELREQEQARLQREQDQIALGDWEAKENEFHLEQAKTRAQIRIKESRAKPIDILAMNLSLASDSKLAEEFDMLGLEMSIEEPYLIFRNLSLQEVEELHKDIQLYVGLEKNEENRKFWDAMMVVCDDELSRHRAAIDGGAYTGVNHAVAEDIEKMFANKTQDQLNLLQKQIEKKLREGGPVDVDYWETAIKALIVWTAKAKLRDMHRFLLRKRLERLKEENIEANQNAKPITYQRERPQAVVSTVGPDLPQVDEGEVETDGEYEEYDPRMSPVITNRIQRNDIDVYEVVTEEADLRQLANAREKVLQSELGMLGTIDAEQSLILTGEAESLEDLAEQAFLREAAESMGMEETAFNEETIISASQPEAYLWHDKYRPRKPRYFNRVHTGYEWNKYNQTHYDSDNPPPKVVQGYKFNIFYPDLIDKSKAPTYAREKDEGYPDTVILRFKAGPPYEDIAFRIVNREWEYSHKKGFRSSFDRGVLQLWFHFKRHHYRR